MLVISTKGISEEIKRLSKLADKEIAKKIPEVSANLIIELKQATPVDTGAARDAWRVDKKLDGSAEIINDKEYIDALNAGSSQQAPPFFIEKTILKNKDVKPFGTIVKYR